MSSLYGLETKTVIQIKFKFDAAGSILFVFGD